MKKWIPIYGLYKYVHLEHSNLRGPFISYHLLCFALLVVAIFAGIQVWVYYLTHH